MTKVAILLKTMVSTTIVSKGRTRVHDKPITVCAAFVEAVRGGGPAPVDEAELIETSLATVAILESLQTGGSIRI